MSGERHQTLVEIIVFYVLLFAQAAKSVRYDANSNDKIEKRESELLLAVSTIYITQNGVQLARGDCATR